MQEGVPSGAGILQLVGALLQADEEDNVPITEHELLSAYLKGKTAFGEDGVTYSVPRLLQKVPDNALFQLYYICLHK